MNGLFIIPNGMSFFFQSFTCKRYEIFTCMVAYSKLEIPNLVVEVINKGKTKKFFLRQDYTEEGNFASGI